MSTAHPTRPAKPSKPYADFPLFPHATGRWAKKIRGRMHYFGPWADPEAALRTYLDQRDALHAGRKPREVMSAGVTVKDVCNAFLNHKQALVDAGELSPRTWKNGKEAADLVVARFGKGRVVADVGQDDFAALRAHMSKRWGPVRLGDFIQRIRCIFKYAHDAELIPAPVRFGPGFDRPSKKVLRLNRAQRGPKMFEAAELRAMIGGALVKGPDGEDRQVEPTTPLRAMILLGVNCGFGNADCATLPLAALDLQRGWVTYPRPKTGAPRRCPLWPETVAALRKVIETRKEPKDPAHAGLVFVTKRGASWYKAEERGPISTETRKLLDALGVGGNRNFYALRHTFETIGGESRDQVAVDHIMGHARNDMASVYRERISDERLAAVSDGVRAWVFAEGQAAEPGAAKVG